MRITNFIRKLKKINLKTKKTRLIPVIIVMAMVGVVGTITLLFSHAAVQVVYDVPTSITQANCGRDITAELNTFIKSVPDNSVIKFPAGACYGVNGDVQIDDRTGLTLDGSGGAPYGAGGATFKLLNYNNDDCQEIWQVRGGTNIGFQNMVLRGINPIGYDGVRDNALSSQCSDGVRFDSTQGARVINAAIYDVRSDPVYSGSDRRFSACKYLPDGTNTGMPGEARPVRNLLVDGVFASNFGRTVGLSNTDGAIIQNSTFDDAYDNIVDQESDAGNCEFNRNTRLLNNHFGRSHFSIVTNSGGESGENAKNNEFSGNIMDQDMSNCNPAAFYAPGGGHTEVPTNAIRSGLTIKNNVLKTHGGDGLRVFQYSSGIVAGNTFIQVNPLNTGCYNPNFTPQNGLPVRQVSSSVTIATSNTFSGFDTGNNTPPAGTDDKQPTETKVTAPINGAGVSGTMTLSASASDDVGVARIEFLVDGNVVGTATSAPFSVTWDAGAATNGGHTIIAHAYDAAGNAPGTSSAVNVITGEGSTTPPPDTIPPTSPSNLSGASANSTQVSLTWTAATDNVGVTKYHVFRNGTMLPTEPTTTSFYDTGLTASTSYSYTVKAVDAAGNVGPASNTATVTTPNGGIDPVACAAPANFAGTAGSAGSGQYNFTWSASQGASSYSLYQGSPPSTLYYEGYTSSSATAFGLAPGQPYTFAVRSKCGSTLSANSNVLTVTAPANCTGSCPPVTLTGDINHDGKVDFNDALLLIRKWNTTDPDSDINHDGKVDFNDAIQIIRNWSR